MAAKSRLCEQCGEEFTPRRSDQRYHSAACRKRAEREREASTTDEDRDLVEEITPEIGRLELAAFVELDKANALRSPNAQAALMLARRLDLGIREAGSSTAALVREMRTSLAVALGNAVPSTEDELEKVRRLRDQHRGRRSAASDR